MNFVIVAFLSQAMSTYNIGYLGPELDKNHKNPEEDYFAITDKALIRVLLTIAYNLEAKQYEDNTYDVKKTENFFSVETQLFESLVEYYEMKSKDASHDQNRSKNLNELGDTILNLSNSFDEAYYLAVEFDVNTYLQLKLVGYYALKEYKEKVLEVMTNKTVLKKSTQNPSTDSTPAHEDLNMRVVLNAICAVYQYSREFYVDVCKRYDIPQKDQLTKIPSVESFLGKNSKLIVSEVSIMKFASKRIKEWSKSGNLATNVKAIGFIIAGAFWLGVAPFIKLYENL